MQQESRNSTGEECAQSVLFVEQGWSCQKKAMPIVTS